MVLASFKIDNKLKQSQFFKENFLMTGTSVAVILSILFLIFSNADILFAE